MAFDIFDSPVTKIAYGIEGKSILIYGGNKCGKTWQAVHMPKPYLFSFEYGAEAVNGVPYCPVKSWDMFMSALKQFVTKASKAHEQFQTLIFDQLDAMEIVLTRQVCGEAGVKSLADKPLLPNGKQDGWWNGHTELSSKVGEAVLIFKELMSLGYTLVFIGHAGTRKINDAKLGEYEKTYPRGNKRLVDPIVDLVGFICYVASNGTDAQGNLIKSSLYLSDTPERLGGGRFITMASMLPEFTSEALVECVTNATASEAASVGVQNVTNAEIVAEQKATNLMGFEEVKSKITELGLKVYNGALARYPEIQTIIEKWLGAGRTISQDATEDDTDAMCSIYMDLIRFMESDPDLRKLVA